MFIYETYSTTKKINCKLLKNINNFIFKSRNLHFYKKNRWGYSFFKKKKNDDDYDVSKLFINIKLGEGGVTVMKGSWIWKELGEKHKNKKVNKEIFEVSAWFWIMIHLPLPKREREREGKRERNQINITVNKHISDCFQKQNKK